MQRIMKRMESLVGILEYDQTFCDLTSFVETFDYLENL